MGAAVAYKYDFSKKNWFEKSGYVPHPGQKPIHDCEARFIVAIKGRRWGKSLSMAKEAEAMILTPGTRGWVVSKTYDLAYKIFREIYADLVIKYRLKPIKQRLSNKLILEFSWGSSVEGKSAEHPDSLVGDGLDWLIFDEFAKCKPVIWEEYLRPTLVDREGWARFISTPKGYNWAHDLWKRGRDLDFPEWASFKGPSWENPHLSKEDIDEAERTTSERTFAQEYGANFTLSSGQVYSDFDERSHVIDESDLILDPGWDYYRSFDFGYENPFVCLYIAVTPDDRVIIYDEYYHIHRTNEEHCLQLHQNGESFQKVRWSSSDPSGASARATLLENGISTVGVRSKILQGLEDVRSQIKYRPDGTPGLYVSSKCINTIKEFNLYSYPDNGDKEEPEKDNDHAMDALRYFIVNWRRGHVVQRTGRY